MFAGMLLFFTNTQPLPLHICFVYFSLDMPHTQHSQPCLQHAAAAAAAACLLCVFSKDVRETCLLR